MWDTNETAIFRSENRWELRAWKDPSQACIRIVFDYERASSGHVCTEKLDQIVMAMESWAGFNLTGQFAIMGIAHPDTDKLIVRLGARRIPLVVRTYEGRPYFADLLASPGRPKGFLIMEDAAGRVLERIALCADQWMHQESSCFRRA